MRWDIFCNVVDNLGDIGVCWRLSRQLAAEHGAAVRLWVDDLAAFRRLAPAIDPRAAAQPLGGIEVRHWSAPFPAEEPARVVVETFGCELPASYIQAMAACPQPPVWINLEYLSAEDWVGGCHRLPSPRGALTKYFFFPGFTPDTGGVLIGDGMDRERRAFQSDPAACARFLATLGVPADGERETRVSLFCYPQAPVGALVDAWSAGEGRMRLITFAGTPAAEALAAHGLGQGSRNGRLAVSVVPFLSQDDYDRVLWACDWNFVRGEDSFVRAQLAGRPLVWQAYPQAGDAHRLKIEAFLVRYQDDAAPGEVADLADLWAVWNGFAARRRFSEAWAACNRAGGLADLAGRWSQRLAANGDLAANLAKFCAERL